MPATVRLINRLYGAVMVLVVVVGTLVAALFIAKGISNSETTCINRTLGDRNPIQKADTDAHVEFARRLAAARTRTQIKAAAEEYADQLNANQRARDQHPLGAC